MIKLLKFYNGSIKRSIGDVCIQKKEIFDYFVNLDYLKFLLCNNDLQLSLKMEMDDVHELQKNMYLYISYKYRN